MAALETDITVLPVTAIVNAANPGLLGGGGVDGAIHRAAGPGLLEECRRLGGCPTGEARLTGGHGLPAAFVIHTVGPVWRGGGQGEAGALAACYRSVLALAAERRMESVAFPAVSCGSYGYPLESAATIAVAEVGAFLAAREKPERVLFACHGQGVLRAYSRALAKAREA